MGFSVAEKLLASIGEAGGSGAGPSAKKRLFEGGAEEDRGDDGEEMTDVKTIEDLVKRAGNGSSPSGSSNGAGKPPLGAASNGGSAAGPPNGANGAAAAAYAQQNGFSFRSPSPGPHEASPYYGHSQSHKKEGNRLLKHQLRLVSAPPPVNEPLPLSRAPIAPCAPLPLSSPPM